MARSASRVSTAMANDPRIIEASLRAKERKKALLEAKKAATRLARVNIRLDAQCKKWDDARELFNRSLQLPLIPHQTFIYRVLLLFTSSTIISDTPYNPVYFPPNYTMRKPIETTNTSRFLRLLEGL